MTRAEFAALLADIAGLRLRPAELDTIKLAADAYALESAKWSVSWHFAQLWDPDGEEVVTARQRALGATEISKQDMA